MDDVSNIYIENGTIVGISAGEPDEGWETAKVIEAAGLYVVPGLVDVHVHFRDPGLTEKEDIFSGARAAAAGGVTSVVCMPNTNPTVSTPEVVREILEKARKADCRVYPLATITKDMKGMELSDFEALLKAGAAGFSDDGKPVANARLMQEAMVRCQELNVPIASHCEDLDIIGNGKMNLGEISKELGVPGMDRTSEDSVTAREIALAAGTGSSVHICHVSTKGSVDILRDAKARGVKVTAETGPHYFMLTDELLRRQDADYRMNPPLRTEEDRIAVLEALRDGVIDVIATDHAPHTPAQKQDFIQAPNGVVGLETSFGACMTSLVHTGIFSLYALIERMSTIPAKLMHLPAGSLKPGCAADLMMFDPDEEWIVDPSRFRSKSRNSPFKGMTFKGKVKLTLLSGRIVYDSRCSDR
jgi:dihydroorotase